MIKDVVHSSALPEEFLKVFGFNYNSNLSKLEIIFEALEPAVVHATTVDNIESSLLLTKDMVKRLVEFANTCPDITSFQRT